MKTIIMPYQITHSILEEWQLKNPNQALPIKISETDNNWSSHPMRSYVLHTYGLDIDLSPEADNIKFITVVNEKLYMWYLLKFSHMFNNL